MKSLLFVHSHDVWGFMVHSVPNADVRGDQHMDQGTHNSSTAITSTEDTLIYNNLSVILQKMADINLRYISFQKYSKVLLKALQNLFFYEKK